MATRIVLQKARIIACALAALAMTSASAGADGYELSLGSATRFTSSTSAQALSDSSLVLFSMTGAARIDRVRIPGFEFLLDSSIELGGMSGVTFQTLDTTTTMQSAGVGARLRRSLAGLWPGSWAGSWMGRWTVQARANLGGARVHVALDDLFASQTGLSDTAYTATAYVGAGADFALATMHSASGRERFTLGLSAELGYLAMVPVSMDARPEQSGDDDIIRIPEMSASLGTLNLSAWGLRFGLTGRF